MRIAFLCKRQYMAKDVILDRYARLYELPYQLACLGHEVLCFCLSYQDHAGGQWQNEVEGNGTLRWESRSSGVLKAPVLLAYPFELLKKLHQFKPDVLVGASDIPHIALTCWLARRMGVPFMADLYDNFEGFGQARIPGFVPVLRQAVRQAALVTTTSEPLRQMVIGEYKAQGTVISLPSSVDLSVFHGGNKTRSRQLLGLPMNAPLVGTAGGLYRDKGVEPIYQAWSRLSALRPDLHLVLAGPYKTELPPPSSNRVHYLGHLSHAQVADLFRALDVGIISILDTPFGKYCFPQKAYEMLACGLPVAAANVGQMSTLFQDSPSALFSPGNAEELTMAVLSQLEQPITHHAPIQGWAEVIAMIEPALAKLCTKGQRLSAEATRPSPRSKS